MEDKKWYWDNLNLLYTNQNSNHTTWGNYNDFIIVIRKNYIKLIHRKLYTELIQIIQKLSKQINN